MFNSFDFSSKSSDFHQFLWSEHCQWNIGPFSALTPSLALLYIHRCAVHLSKRYMFPRVWRRIIRPGDILACKAHTFLQYLVDSCSIFDILICTFFSVDLLSWLVYCSFFYYCKIRCSRRGVQSSTECCCIGHCPLYSITYTHINTYQMLSNFASCLSRIK